MYARYLNDIGFFQTASVRHTISKNGQVYFGTRVKNSSCFSLTSYLFQEVFLKRKNSSFMPQICINLQLRD